MRAYQLEKAILSDAVMDRVVGLFSLYTFHSSQPALSLFSIYEIRHIPIALGMYKYVTTFLIQFQSYLDEIKSLLDLPCTVSLALFMAGLRPYVTWILQYFLTRSLFFVLPDSTLFPHNPRFLPREVFESISEVPCGNSSVAVSEFKHGRLSKKERIIKARTAINGLSKWIDKNSHIDYEPAASMDGLLRGMSTNNHRSIDDL